MGKHEYHHRHKQHAIRSSKIETPRSWVSLNGRQANMGVASSASVWGWEWRWGEGATGGILERFLIKQSRLPTVVGALWRAGHASYLPITPGGPGLPKSPGKPLGPGSPISPGWPFCPGIPGSPRDRREVFHTVTSK